MNPLIKSNQAALPTNQNKSILVIGSSISQQILHLCLEIR